MKKYRLTLVPRLVIEVEANTVYEAESRSHSHGLDAWDWTETIEESIQQQNPDGSWGPVMDEEWDA